jgi:hypothetical protein
MTIPCPFCNQQIDPTAFFCPVCGKNVRVKPLSVTVGTQILVYLLSVLVPPFGLGLTFRYLRSPDPKAKKIGWISVVLTFIALIFVCWLTFYYTRKITDQVDREMQKYMGF